MKMKRLRLFISRNARFSEEPIFFSNELRLLDWSKYPGESLPSNFRGENLVALRMHNSHLKELEGVQNFQNMTIMDFTGCEYLRKVPDVSRIPNLARFILDGCVGLVEVHGSVGFLDKLVRLSLANCSNLRSFPRRLKLRSLESLVLSGCSRIKNFPEIECEMKFLVYFDSRDTGIEELPSSIGYLVGIKYIYLDGCTNLMNLPNSINQLQHLEHLSLYGCSKVVKFLQKVEDNRQSMPSIGSTEESDISSGSELLRLTPRTNTSNSIDGCSSVSFPRLRTLSLSNCALSESNFLISSFDCFFRLKTLYLSRSDIVTLPRCIKRFVGLEFLYLNECKQLREILGLPPNVKYVDATGCVSLAIFLEEPVRVRTLSPTLQLLSLGNNVLTELDFLIQFDCPPSLEYLYLSSSAIVSLPAWLNKFAGLVHLHLEDCKKLREIPELPPNIIKVYARRCRSLERFEFNKIYNLPMLLWSDLSDCHELRQNIGNDVQIRLLSEGHSKELQFGCIFPGNKVPDWFNHRSEVLNSNSCEMDINEPAHLDGEIIKVAFSAVIGMVDGKDGDSFQVVVQVINNGVTYKLRGNECYSSCSDHIWLHYNVQESFKLKGDNLRVKFKCEDKHSNPSKSVLFKSCGFHLIRMYEEKVIDLNQPPSFHFFL